MSVSASSKVQASLPSEPKLRWTDAFNRMASIRRMQFSFRVSSTRTRTRPCRCCGRYAAPGLAGEVHLSRRKQKTLMPISCNSRLACARPCTTSTRTCITSKRWSRRQPKSSMRAVLGQTIHQFPVPDAKTPADGLKQAESFLNRFRGDDLYHSSRGPARCLYQLR